MAAETQAPATQQSSNGTAPLPAPDAAPCEDCASTSERVMGALGIGAAIGLAFIGIDLLTGGALSRALFPARDADASGE